MYQGYLHKRNVPISPPSMSRIFCVLWGTMLFDYDSEEESKSSISPKVVSEILGISEWDGQGRANQYPNGFLLVTHTGGTYYLSASSAADRDEWILHVKRALECHFANSEIIPFKPSKIINIRPQPHQNSLCPRTGVALSATASSSGPICRSCGRSFSSFEYVSFSATLLQVGSEAAEKVCQDCCNIQVAILWLKSLNYTHAMTLHDLTPAVNRDIGRFKASFKLNRRPAGSRLDMAAMLLEQGNVNPDEFEELRRVDHDYKRETMMEEAEKLKLALDALGEDMQTIISLLLNPAATDRGRRMSYFQVIVKILEIADREPELLDFYFPQLLQAHLIEVANRTASSMMKVDLLQQALLVLAQKYPQLGLKLAWSLMSVFTDYSEKRVTQVQFAACCALLLQLELIVTGFVSPIADIPQCKLLSNLLRAASHQQNEIASELGTLFLVRRRLQEVYCEEEEARKNRHIFQLAHRDGAYHAPDDSPDTPEYRETTMSVLSCSSPSHANMLYVANGGAPSCMLLFNHLGVGQAAPRDSPSASRDSNDSSDGPEAVVETDLSPKEPVDTFRGLPHWTGFCTQLDFMNRMNTVVDNLRFIDRTARGDKLAEELEKLNREAECAGGYGVLGWDPTGGAGEPTYRITRILVPDCRVFRTKARAPSLIVCEVVRDDSEDGLETIDPPREKFASPAASESLPSTPIVSGPDHSSKSRSYPQHTHDPRQRTRTCSADVERMLAEGSPLKARPDVDLHLSQVGVLVDISISQAIADIHLAERSQRESGPQTISPFGKGIASDNSRSSDKDTFPPPPVADPVSTVSPLQERGSAVPRRLSGSLLSSHRKSGSTNFQSLLSSASTEELQLITRDSSAPEPLVSPMGAIPPKIAFLKSEEMAEQLAAIGPNGSDHGMALSVDDPDPNVKQQIFLSAQKLLKEGKIDETEYALLMKSDDKFRDESAREEVVATLLKVESAFGESWVAKKERILGARFDAASDGCHDDAAGALGLAPTRGWPKWDLRAFIIKSNDDLRQEVCCIQLMRLFHEILIDFGLGNQLWLRPYAIVSTGSSTGVVQVLTDTLSIDALKKVPGFVSLPSYFTQTYGSSAERLLAAKRNFAASLAAYSLFCYILAIKDRHNGNMLIDTEGHIIHIDFGFLLSIAPGGAFSLETAPFKLTEEFVEVLDGLESPLFGEFVKAFTTGFLALRANSENIIETVQVLSINSPFPCFVGKDSTAIIERLRYRFRADLGLKDFVQHCLDLIIGSYGHYGTRQYDTFQWYTNGILY